MEEKQKNVLDYGFVRLVDSMGSDASVVQAARVSYGSGTKTHSQDRQLIHYLMEHQHTSPFEMCEVKFHCKMPIFVARQWVRHRTANINEYSGRYSEMKNEFYSPRVFNKQSEDNKQGSSEETINVDKLYYHHHCEDSFAQYNEYLKEGASREQARIVLPLSTYTEWYWKCDLHNIFNFLRLRADSHAQYEIRVYAEAICEFVKELFPICYEAFEEYKLNSISLSQSEQIKLSKLIKAGDIEGLPTKKRKEREFKDKLSLIINSSRSKNEKT